jgi:hypothetical protein
MSTPSTWIPPALAAAVGAAFGWLVAPGTGLAGQLAVSGVAAATIAGFQLLYRAAIGKRDAKATRIGTLIVGLGLLAASRYPLAAYAAYSMRHYETTNAAADDEARALSGLVLPADAKQIRDAEIRYDRTTGNIPAIGPMSDGAYLAMRKNQAACETDASNTDACESARRLSAPLKFPAPARMESLWRMIAGLGPQETATLAPQTTDRTTP